MPMAALPRPDLDYALDPLGPVADLSARLAPVLGAYDGGSAAVAGLVLVGLALLALIALVWGGGEAPYGAAPTTDGDEPARALHSALVIVS